MEMGFTTVIASGFVGLLLGVLGMLLFQRYQKEQLTANHAAQRALLQARIEEAENELQQTKAQAAAEQAMRDAKAQTQEHALAEMVAEAEQRLAQEKQRLASAENKLTTSQKENERLFLETQQAHIELGHLEPALAEQQAQNAQLRDDLASLSDTNQALETRLKNSQKTLDDTNAEVGNLQTELTALRNEAATLRVNNQELTVAHREKADEYYTLSNQYQELLTHRTELTRELDSIQQLLTQVMSTLRPNQDATAKESSPSTPSTEDDDDASEDDVAGHRQGNLASRTPPLPPPKQVAPLSRPSPFNRTAQNVIFHFLTNAKITVTEFLPPQCNAPQRIQLAQMLADHYKPLKPLHKLLKRSLNDGNEHAMRFSNINRSTTQLMQEFGALAESQRLLSHFEMSQHGLSARSADTKDAQAFLSGIWMEQYIAYLVEEVVAELQADHRKPLLFGYLTNVQVDLPSGEHREMDMLFHVNGHMFWIEVKSSEYHQFIEKYATISQYLPLDKSHTILVAAEPTQQDILYRNRYTLSIYAIHEFANRVRATLKADLQK